MISTNGVTYAKQNTRGTGILPVSIPPRYPARPVPLGKRDLLFCGLLVGAAALGPQLPAQVVVGPGAVPATVQLPTFGVAIDAEGVLSAHQFGNERIVPARARAEAKVELHAVSLPRLQQAVEGRLAQGARLDDELLNLAGLTRVEYVVVDPTAHDIVLVGPCEPWLRDPAGRVLGANSLRPVLLLEDLSTALRAFPVGQPPRWVGCSINPSSGALQRLRQVDRALPSAIRAGTESLVAANWLQQARDALGSADVVVFGISPATHMARVFVEADYRMKLIALGLEPPPVRMPTFFSQAVGSRGHLQRWWFTPDPRCVRIDRDPVTLQLVGQGVRLGTEDYAVQHDGSLRRMAGQPNRAARRFAEAFTEKYEEIARVSPIYGHLRAAIDLLIIAAFLQKYDVWQAVQVSPSVWGDDALLPEASRRVPRSAECAVNAAWRGRRMIAVSGGGVSIQADRALSPESVLSEPPEAGDQLRAAIRERRPAEPQAWHWSLGDAFPP